MFGYQSVKFFYLVFVAVEQLDETRLRTRSAFATEKFQPCQPVFHFFDVHAELVCPQGCAFTDRCQLCRLQVRIRQTRHIFVFFGKFAKIFNYFRRFCNNYFACLAYGYNIFVIADVTTGCAKVNYPRRFGTKLTVSINVTHYVVARFLLSGLCHGVVYIAHMCLHLRYLLVGNVQTELFFRTRQSYPEFAPRGKLEVV